MNGLAGALIMGALAAWLGMRAWRGRRTGAMPFDITVGAMAIRFDRYAAPAWFWGTLVAHVVASAGSAAGGALLLFWR